MQNSKISDAQLAANRANAQHSTGPRTPAGKLASSNNARSHGLTGRVELQNPAEQLAYAQLGQRIIVEYKPCTIVEEQLAHTVLDAQWQMNCARALDQEIWNEREAARAQNGGRAVFVARPDGLTMELVTRYFQIHTRVFFKAVEQLTRIQNARRRAERNALIAAREDQLKHSYNRRKHGIILPPDGFVLSESTYHVLFTELAADARAKMTA
jgi:hypothetical protein